MNAVLVLLAVVAADALPEKSGPWSKPVRGLQARITLVEKAKINGTRSLVPYLELRNVGSSATPLKVRCGEGHVKFELVGLDGKTRSGYNMPRSGPHADPGTVSLPSDSSMRLGMYCSNWGVPRNAAAMIATDSGAWVLKPNDRGGVFLRATLKGDKKVGTWHGTMQVPVVKVEWKD
jgi:hypothetical protein